MKGRDLALKTNDYNFIDLPVYSESDRVMRQISGQFYGTAIWNPLTALI